MGNIIKDFYETFGIEDHQSRKTEVGSKNARIGSNVERLPSIFFLLATSTLIRLMLFIIFSQ